MGNKLQKRFEVSSFFVGENKELTISNLMCLLQEVAWEHSNLNNCGWSSLQQHGVFWAVARFRVIIQKMPQWNDKILISTWGKPVEKIIHPRDYEVYDKNSNKIIVASSSWLIVDMNTSKPHNMFFEGEDKVIVDEHAIKESIPKIPKIEIKDGTTSVFKDVVYSDIDMNSHVNNTKYIQWIIDDFPPNFIQNHIIKEFIVNFISQAVLGMKYYISTKEISTNNFVSMILREDNNKELCIIQTIWE